MNQLTQKLKSGEMTIQELPMPVASAGMVIVRNHYSLISAGTEGSTIMTARKGLIGKARERPQQVRQVIGVLKKQGPVQTYRAVMKKLDGYSPLGYSCSGEVIEVGEGVKGFAAGDTVACAGAGYASHAEVVSVPENLCVKLDNDADLKAACYNTVGAIALQGIRQADLRLGESCAVIGLGLIGQLTCLMLRASGVKTIGVDIDSAAVETAEKHCVDVAFLRSELGVAEQISRHTNGIGTDAVIITAATENLDPINFAGQIARKKGRVVIVGAVPTGFDRDPDYYKKELEVRMSCSYGPGRYDMNYEEKGIDYPVGYVRWTENRNMQAFQDLIRRGSINLSYLSTHEFLIDDAVQAYDMLIKKEEPFLGIILRYDTAREIKRERVRLAPDIKPQAAVGIAFIGAGSYAQGNLLPHIPKGDSNVVCRCVMTHSGTSSKRVAEKFGFESCTSDMTDIISDDRINTVFIATHHNSHADYVLKALKAGMHVFVEKPLCIKENELLDICSVMTNGHNQTAPGKLMVGYNRRFAPLTQIIKKEFINGPMSMIYRVNSGNIPADSWIQDMEIGGGRILGEVCHFVDLLSYMNGSLPISVYANSMKDPNNFNDVLNVSLAYENGSIGTICYYANGDKSFPKERIEIFADGSTAVLDDFKTLTIYSCGKKRVKKLLTQDKGQKSEVKLYIDSIRNGNGEVIPFDEVYNTSFVTFKILESIRTRECINVETAVPHIYTKN